MSENTYSFVMDRRSASEVFSQVGKRELLLAVLATLAPEAHWDGCLVYEGESPQGEVNTVCVGTCGPGADEVQERLVEAFEKQGVRILQIYEGGPEVRESFARVESGKWVSAVRQG